MRTWRIEAWTHPRKGTPTYITDVPHHGAHLADRRDAIVDSHVLIPATRTDVLDLINTADPTDPSTGVSTLLRVWPVDTDPAFVEPELPDFEFFAARRDEEIGEDDQLYVKIAGPDVRAAADDAALLPFDYPGTTVGAGKRTTFPDHIWGGNNLAVNGDLEDGTTNAVQQVWIVDDADGATTLNGGIDATTTTVTVTDAASFPGAAPFTVQIDDERLRVTAGAGTTTWTVTRGADGTTAAAHADAAPVAEVAHGTFTLTFDGEATGNLDWNPPTGPTVDADGIKTALQTLPNIIAVDVTGSGTPADPFEIEFLDPGGDVATLGGTDAIFGGNLAAGLVVQAGGVPTINGWTHSYNPGTGLDHGTYAAEKVTGEDVLGVGPITGTGSLWVYGSSLHAGAQQIREVPPGALAQFAVNHRTIETGQTYRFVVRDLNENHIASAEYTPAALTVTPMALTDVTIPAGVNAVIVRVGVVGPAGLTRSWWQLDDLVIRLGHPPATKGKIARTLLDDLQTDHAPRVRLGWLTRDASIDTVDSAGVPWVDELEFAASWGRRLGSGVFTPLFFETGGDWDIEPILDGGGAPTVWELKTWEVGSRGVDRTADADPHFIIGAGISGGALSFQEPPYTALTVANADGYFIEAESAALVAAYGHVDGFLSSPHYRNMLALGEAATHALDVAAVNQVSAQTRITAGGPIPWHDFDKADRVNFSLPGRVDTTHARTISQIVVDIKPSGEWEAEVTASRLFTGIAAAEEGVRLLLERFDELERTVAPSGGFNTALPADPTAAGGDPAGAYLHLALIDGQTIAVGGEPVAFDAIDAAGSSGFPAGTTAGAGTLIPKAGYWDLIFSAGWDVWAGGGAVWVTRTRDALETQIWPPAVHPTAWTAASGAIFEDGIAKGLDLRPGDVIRVYIDHGDASPQVLATATLTIELVDRARNNPGQYRELVLSHGPIAYWRLDETAGTDAVDETGNGHTGTYTGGPTLAAAPVMADGSGSPSVSFTAAQYVAGVDWADTRFLGRAPFTVEAWFHASNVGGARAIVTHSKGYSPGDGDGWSMDIGAGELLFTRYDRTNFDRVGATVTVDTDHHGAATFDGTTLRLYLDGVLVDSAVAAIDIDAHSVPLRIAIGDNNGTAEDANGFIGRIDEVAIWDRPLAAVEIAAHYATGTQGA